MPTPDGSVIPRYHWEEPVGQPANIKSICNISQYGADTLVLGETQAFYEADAEFVLYKNNVKIPINSYIGLAPLVPYGGFNLQQSYRFNDTMYYLNPYGGSLFKYDGVELGYAGCNPPKLATSGYLSAGTRYLKIIQHVFDFDTNEPVSGFTEFPTSSASVTINTNGYVPAGFTEVPSAATNIFPKTWIASQGNNGNYFIGTATYSALNQDYTISFVPARSGTVSVAGTSMTVPEAITPRNGTLSVAGVTVTALSTTADLSVGMTVFGTGVPLNTTIVTIVSGTSITVSNSITAGTKLLSFSDLFPGITVYGTSIPASTTILTMSSSTVINLSNTIPIRSGTVYFGYNNTNITSSRIGSYVFVAASKAEMITMGYLSSNQYRGLALRVKSVSPLVLDATYSKKLSDDRVWNTSIGPDSFIAPYISYGTRTFFTYWESNSSTGDFFYRAMTPSFPDNFHPYTSGPARATIATTGVGLAAAGSDAVMFTISPILGDWFDTNSIKITPNAVWGGFGNTSFSCMTKYQDLLVLANDQYIYFSDTSLGGWTDMFSDRSSILVGDLQYGRITSICGTGDFLFVSRERKNYYVNGNIVTGNYRVQEIADVQNGAWNNVSSLQVNDSVVFINSTGVFALSQGGVVKELSAKCRKNFDSFNPNSIDEDVSFRLTGTPSSDYYVSDLQGIASAYDTYRGLVIFMKREAGNPALVFNVKTGEAYEWDGVYLGDANIYANCIQFIAGKYLLGGMDITIFPHTSTAKYALESFTVPKTYLTTNPLKMYTTWLTVGEPSLEKEVLQLKIFGRISTPNSGLKVKHYKDWDKNTAITDTTYFPIVPTATIDNQIQFSHKKRLNSDKCLSASVGIEISDPTTTFEIESFEVEFNSIQSGMKR